MNDDNDKKNDNVVNIQKYDVAAFEKERLPYAMICVDIINKCTNYLAGWIWLYLQGKPPTWIPCKWEIIKRFDISERTYQRHMRYLSATNLIENCSSRNADGTMGTWRIKVLNGSKFNPTADNYKGTVYSVHVNHTAKNGVVDDTAPDKGFDHTAKNGVVDFNHTAKKPHSGGIADHIYNRSSSTNDLSHTQEEFFLEQNLFIDSEQQRKAIVMRKLCLNDEKSKTKHSELATDKTFVECLDECVSHYATQQNPQLVSPQRLQSWLNRESRFQLQQEAYAPAKKYPTKNERAEQEKKTAAIERESEKRKKEEIQAGKGFKDMIKKSRMESDAELEADRIKRGMTKMEHAAFVLSQPRAVQE